MCKTQSITYTCGHTVNFRLSVCAASFQFQKRKSEVKAKCCASPNITFHSLHACGPCEREAAQQKVQSQLAVIEAKFPSSGWTIAPEVVTAKSEAEQALWKLTRAFPDSKFKVKKLPKPERGWSTITQPKSSLLRLEVKREDVVEQMWDEWGGAISLSDEIAKIEAERAADGIPPLAPMISVFEDDNEWGDVMGLGVCEQATPSTQGQFSAHPVRTHESNVQPAERKSPAKSTFVPPHRRNHHRLREKAQQALRETKSTTSNHMGSDATNVIRRCAAPLM